MSGIQDIHKKPKKSESKFLYSWTDIRSMICKIFTLLAHFKKGFTRYLKMAYGTKSCRYKVESS